MLRIMSFVYRVPVPAPPTAAFPIASFDYAQFVLTAFFCALVCPCLYASGWRFNYNSMREDNIIDVRFPHSYIQAFIKSEGC